MELVASSLPPYLSDVARFAYETGTRSGEMRQLFWKYVKGDAIEVPKELCKNREARSIVITAEIAKILERREAAKVASSDLIFHNQGRKVADYRKVWQTACIVNGLGAYYCRDCRDAEGKYIGKLDATQQCERCGKKWEKVKAKYIGRIMHDFRRSAAHEMWRAGNSAEECMEVTGHKTRAMFDRYADLFSKEEKQARQRSVQDKRRVWREAQQAKAQAVVPVVSTQVQ